MGVEPFLVVATADKVTLRPSEPKTDDERGNSS